MFKAIIQFGYRSDLPSYLKRRIEPTNITALLLLFVVAIPFAILTPIYFPASLTFIPVSGMVTCIGVLVANRMGAIKYSRLFLSILPVTQAALYNLFLCGPSDDPIPSVHLISLAFALVPFVTFDLKEKVMVICTSLYSMGLILSFPITRSWITLAADTSVLRHGWLSVTTLVLGILTAFCCMIGLAMISKQAEIESEESRLKAEERSQVLLNQQEENKQKTEALEKAQAEEKKRQWASDGLTQLMEIIRRNSGSEGAFDEMMATIVSYLGANQGGIFTANRDSDSSTHLRLVSCYAYQRKKFVKKVIELGEGLVGQVFMEQQSIRLTEIPANYVQITSGLGKANPTSLLIVPLMVNDVVEGVIELASFQTFSDHEVAFVEKLGETIASYIQTQRTTHETKLLLTQAQEQAEELRAAEEEMRQNQEELQATQEEMNRRYQALEQQAAEREQQLINKISELERSNGKSSVSEIITG